MFGVEWYSALNEFSLFPKCQTVPTPNTPNVEGLTPVGGQKHSAVNTQNVWLCSMQFDVLVLHNNKPSSSVAEVPFSVLESMKLP
jgi:hypothetical protein